VPGKEFWESGKSDEDSPQETNKTLWWSFPGTANKKVKTKGRVRKEK
jgi:hypothetical protein